MKWTEFLREYFTFTRKERLGLLTVILVIVGIWIFPKVSRPRSPKTIPSDTSWITAARNLIRPTNDSDNQPANVDNLALNKPLTEHAGESSGHPFYFDPNTLPPNGWRKLGIRDKTIATIQNYLQKGGHFYKAEDLSKIYGIHSDEYVRIEPYIRIAATNRSRLETSEKIESKKEFLSDKPKYTVVDINTADTSAFVDLPGIGNKLASRIVNFREKLGGFYSIDQIGETYGLPDSTFQKIKPFLKLETNLVKRFNVNTATKDEMKTHPYIKWNLANAIVEYRNQHGNFSSLEDIKKISLITAEAFDKVKFYLTL